MISILGQVDRHKLPVSIVHGDPWPGNSLFLDDVLVALVDWEEVTLGDSLYDLAWLAVNSCYPNGKFDSTLFKVLIQSYETVRTLAQYERHCFNPIVQSVVCIGYLWLLQQSVAKGELTEDGVPGDWLLDRNLSKLKLKHVG